MKYWSDVCRGFTKMLSAVQLHVYIKLAARFMSACGGKAF